jgi:hypothetical protein
VNLVWLHLQEKLCGVRLFPTSILVFVAVVKNLTDIDALNFCLPCIQVNMLRLPTTQKMMVA